MGEEIYELKKYRSFAIFGGTLDPIHKGHIESAKNIKKITGVEKILLLPLGVPPHKDARKVTDGWQRYEMTKLAVGNDDDFLISSMEIEREGNTYTIDTIRELRHKLGEKIEFYFIFGADEVFDISTWKDYKELLKICSFFAITRPRYNSDRLKIEIDMLKEEFDANIILVETPEIDVSSSEIRKMVKEGKSITGLVNKEVEEYIIENNLYKE